MQRENTRWYFVLKCIHFQKSTDLGIQWHCRDGVSHDWSQICYAAVDGHLFLILLPHPSSGGLTKMYQAWHKILKQKLKKIYVEIPFLPFVWVSTLLRKECAMCVCVCVHASACVYVCVSEYILHGYMRRPGDSTGSPGAGVTDGDYELSTCVWKLNLRTLEEQQAFLTS